MFFYLVAKLHTILFCIINNFIKYMFQKYYKNSGGEYERDSMGRLKKTDISDEEVKNLEKTWSESKIAEMVKQALDTGVN